MKNRWSAPTLLYGGTVIFLSGNALYGLGIFGNIQGSPISVPITFAFYGVGTFIAGMILIMAGLGLESDQNHG